MSREHWNDVPGDIAGEEAEDLPGGFGTYNPDLDPDAYIDETIETDVISPVGTGFAALDQHGGTTAGAGYAEATTNGATVDPEELLEEGETRLSAGTSGTRLAEDDTPEADEPRDTAA